MKAIAGLVACAAAAALAAGCDNHAAPIVDTTSTTGADFAARDAAASGNATVVTAYDVPPLPAPMAASLPVMQTSPGSAPNVGSGAPAAPLAVAPVARVPRRATGEVPSSLTNGGANGAANADGSSANDFPESSFGARSASPPASDGYVPNSPPSENHGNGTLGSSTGSHELDRNGDSP